MSKGLSLRAEGGAVIPLVLFAILAVGGIVAALYEKLDQAQQEARVKTAVHDVNMGNASNLGIFVALMRSPAATPNAKDPAHAPAMFPDPYLILGPGGTLVANTAPVMRPLRPTSSAGGNLPPWEMGPSGTVRLFQMGYRKLAGGNVFNDGAAMHPPVVAAAARLQSEVSLVSAARKASNPTKLETMTIRAYAESESYSTDDSVAAKVSDVEATVYVPRPLAPACDPVMVNPRPLAAGEAFQAYVRSYGVLTAASITATANGLNTRRVLAPLPDATRSQAHLVAGTGVQLPSGNFVATVTMGPPGNAANRAITLRGEVAGPGQNDGAAPIQCAAPIVRILPACQFTSALYTGNVDDPMTVTVRARGEVQTLQIRVNGAPISNWTYGGPPSASATFTRSVVGTYNLSATVTTSAGETASCTSRARFDPKLCYFSGPHGPGWYTVGACFVRVCPSGPCAGAVGHYQFTDSACNGVSWINSPCGCCGAPTRAGFGCFAEGTKLRLADGKDRAVESIAEGDMLLNPVTGATTRVRRAWKGPEKHALVVVTTAGGTIKVTTKHPFSTDRGLVAASDLKVGDSVLAPGGGFTPVTSIGQETPSSLSEGKSYDVFNVELDQEGEDPRDYQVLAEGGVVSGDMNLQRRLEGASMDMESVARRTQELMEEMGRESSRTPDSSR